MRSMQATSIQMPIFLFFINILPLIRSSDISLNIGSGAASQLLHEAAHLLLTSPRPLHVSLANHHKPLLSSLANVEIINRLSYSALSLKFHPSTIHLHASNLKLRSTINISPNLWPVSFGDEIVYFSLHMADLEVATKISEDTIEMLSCTLREAVLNASSQNYWFLTTLLSFASQPIGNNIEYLMCPVIAKYMQSANSNSNVAKNISLANMIPSHFRQFLSSSDSSLFYRVKTINIEEEHVLVSVQLEWSRMPMGETEEDFSYFNVTDFDLELIGDDRFTVWIDDSAINDMLKQIDWSFQWMEELIAVTSPVIPLSSREFLSTLCSSCYFLLNVWAKGAPTLTTTNNSIIFEKRDRINLRVVNPEKNVTSVFVSMQLSINAELRPSIDDGTVRTLVQLLDTSVIMENGAFPPTWALFMQDLVRGMIIDMMWPEMKKEIEELTYNEGIQLAASCGIDPSKTEILIGEGKIGLSAALNLNRLQTQLCISDLKSALPKASKIFPK